MKRCLLMILCFICYFVGNAKALPSLSHQKLLAVVMNMQVTPLASRVEAPKLVDEKITFFYKDDHTFVMQVNQKEKINGQWHIAPDGKLCSYFNFARKTVLCDYWYDTGVEYLVISTSGDLRSVILKTAVKPLVATR